MTRYWQSEVRKRQVTWEMRVDTKLKARSFSNQKTEAKIGSHILNKMTELGRAKFEVVA